MTDKPTVTQADRERLAKYYADGGASRLLCERIRAGDLDSDPHLQMAAAARIAAEQSRDDVIEECARALQWFVDRKWALQAKFDLHGPADTANAMREILKRSEDALRALKGKKL